MQKIADITNDLHSKNSRIRYVWLFDGNMSLTVLYRPLFTALFASFSFFGIVSVLLNAIYSNAGYAVVEIIALFFSLNVLCSYAIRANSAIRHITRQSKHHPGVSSAGFASSVACCFIIGAPSHIFDFGFEIGRPIHPILAPLAIFVDAVIDTLSLGILPAVGMSLLEVTPTHPIDRLLVLAMRACLLLGVVDYARLAWHLHRGGYEFIGTKKEMIERSNTSQMLRQEDVNVVPVASLVEIPEKERPAYRSQELAQLEKNDALSQFNAQFYKPNKRKVWFRDNGNVLVFYRYTLHRAALCIIGSWLTGWFLGQLFNKWMEPYIEVIAIIPALILGHYSFRKTGLRLKTLTYRMRYIPVLLLALVLIFSIGSCIWVSFMYALCYSGYVMDPIYELIAFPLVLLILFPVFSLFRFSVNILLPR